MVTEPVLAQEAENLVRRARNGDQNAMAMLDEVGRSQSPQSLKAFQAIQEYIFANPFGDEMKAQHKEMCPKTDSPEFHFRCVVLAKGPMLTNQRIDDMANSFTDEMAYRMFVFGVENCNRQVKEHPQIQLGQCVGRARSIQCLALTDFPISGFSPNIAWELGE